MDDLVHVRCKSEWETLCVVGKPRRGLVTCKDRRVCQGKIWGLDTTYGVWRTDMFRDLQSRWLLCPHLHSWHIIDPFVQHSTI